VVDEGRSNETIVAGKDKEANRLPEPKGKFVLVMRIYSPGETPPLVLDGSLDAAAGEAGARNASIQGSVDDGRSTGYSASSTVPLICAMKSAILKRWLFKPKAEGQAI